jgi:hypothetical protein
LQMIQGGSLNSDQVFRLWGIIVALATVGTISSIILTHIASGFIHAIQTKETRDIKSIQDERDKLIELQGTTIAYRVSSIGVALSMLTLVLGQPPLVMFNLLIFFGISAQIIADISRLYLYRQGLKDE